MREQVDLIRESLKYEGPVIFLWRVFCKLMSPLVDISRQTLFELDLSRPVELRQAKVPCVVEEATMAHLAELVDLRFARPERVDAPGISDQDEYRQAVLAYNQARLRARTRINIRLWFRGGERCFVARVDGKVAHSNWTRYPGCKSVPERAIDPQEGEIYTTEGFTAREHRGKALHEATLTHMLKVARDLGYRKAYTIADWANARPRRGLRRVGWAFRGEHLFFTFRGSARTLMLPLRGDVSPIVRNMREQPLQLF